MTLESMLEYAKKPETTKTIVNYAPAAAMIFTLAGAALTVSELLEGWQLWVTLLFFVSAAIITAVRALLAVNHVHNESPSDAVLAQEQARRILKMVTWAASVFLVAALALVLWVVLDQESAFGTAFLKGPAMATILVGVLVAIGAIGTVWVTHLNNTAKVLQEQEVHKFSSRDQILSSLEREHASIVTQLTLLKDEKFLHGIEKISEIYSTLKTSTQEDGEDAKKLTDEFTKKLTDEFTKNIQSVLAAVRPLKASIGVKWQVALKRAKPYLNSEEEEMYSNLFGNAFGTEPAILKEEQGNGQGEV